MKQQIKCLCAAALAVILSVTTVGFSASASDGVYSDPTYDGFELEWTNNGERDVLLSARNSSGVTFYEHDENDLLTKRIGRSGDETYFVHDIEARLLSVQEDGHLISYTYDACGKLEQMNIDGTLYECELDDKGSVVALLDESGEAIVEYTYQGKFLDKVYGRTEDGERVDKTQDEDFIGNWNNVTYSSWYYDEETEWYYCGRFFDVKRERFVDGISMSLEEFEAEYGGVSMFTTNSVSSRADDLYSYMLNSTTFGRTIRDYTPTWYTAIENLDKVARTIYGEAPYWKADKQTVAWVLWNRRQSSVFSEENTLTDVVEDDGQFRALTGDAQWEVAAAMSPSTGSDSWKNSVRYTSYIWAAAELGSTPSGLLPVPTGYSGQMYFCSYESFFLDEDNKAEDRTGQPYRQGAPIYRIFVPLHGAFNTVAAAKAAYDSGSQNGLPYYAEGEKVNVYYSWSP